MSDDNDSDRRMVASVVTNDFRPLRGWPMVMLQAVIRLRTRRAIWAEAYFELVERANDTAVDYARECQIAWPVDPPSDIQ